LDAGPHEVRVVARDSIGLFSLPQVFTITEGGDTTAPVVALTAEPARILNGESSLITIAVTDDLPVIESATIFGPGYPPAGAPLSLTPTRRQPPSWPRRRASIVVAVGCTAHSTVAAPPDPMGCRQERMPVGR